MDNLISHHFSYLGCFYSGLSWWWLWYKSRNMYQFIVNKRSFFTNKAVYTESNGILGFVLQKNKRVPDTKTISRKTSKCLNSETKTLPFFYLRRPHTAQSNCTHTYRHTHTHTIHTPPERTRQKLTTIRRLQGFSLKSKWIDLHQLAACPLQCLAFWRHGTTNTGQGISANLAQTNFILFSPCILRV
jgi:hypothetical protein